MRSFIAILFFAAVASARRGNTNAPSTPYKFPHPIEGTHYTYPYGWHLGLDNDDMDHPPEVSKVEKKAMKEVKRNAPKKSLPENHSGWFKASSEADSHWKNNIDDIMQYGLE